MPKKYPNYDDLIGPTDYAVQDSDGEICLDGNFSADELRMIADRMDGKNDATA